MHARCLDFVPNLSVDLGRKPSCNIGKIPDWIIALRIGANTLNVVVYHPIVMISGDTVLTVRLVIYDGLVAITVGYKQNIGGRLTPCLSKVDCMISENIREQFCCCLLKVNRVIPTVKRHLEVGCHKCANRSMRICSAQHIFDVRLSCSCFFSDCLNYMRGFNGVSTKYLNNYLVWNNLVNYAKESDMEKRNIFLTFVLATLKTAKCRDLSNRPAVPLVA